MRLAVRNTDYAAAIASCLWLAACGSSAEPAAMQPDPDAGHASPGRSSDGKPDAGAPDSGETADGSNDDCEPEVCDGEDNDCDGRVDEELAQNVYYVDSDADGYGDSSASLESCQATPPQGHASRAGDCDDEQAAISPEGIDVCDGVDNDCDGDTDESSGQLLGDCPEPDNARAVGCDTGACVFECSVGFVDVDGDLESEATSGTGCECEQSAATERYCDGVDDDCDGLVDADDDDFEAQTEVCDDGMDNDCNGLADLADPGVDRRSCLDALPLPVAPTVERFMFQGQQTVHQVGGVECTSHVAIAMGDRGVCYADPTGRPFCAGVLYAHDFRGTFTMLDGVSGVDQIIVSRTFNQEDGNAVWVSTESGEAFAMGMNNTYGRLGVGDTANHAELTPWGDSFPDIVALATGTTDSVCAIIGQQAPFSVACAGYGTTSSATLWTDASSSDLGWVWIDTTGQVHVDDATVLRVSNERAEARLTPTSVELPGSSYTPTSSVVSVELSGILSSEPVAQDGLCYLTEQAQVLCQSSPTAPPLDMFPGAVVQGFAGNFDAASLCAIYDDGSVWCRGDNAWGQLGVEDSLLPEPTMVAAAGSARVGCE